MTTIETLLLVLQVFVALTLIGFILIQHGKGADAGAAFGSGASGTVFGSQGSGNFLTKVTTILAGVFLCNSLALGYLATQREAPGSLMENVQTEVAPLNEEQLDAEFEKMLEKANIDDDVDVDVYGSSSELPAVPDDSTVEDAQSALNNILEDTSADSDLNIEGDLPSLPEASETD